MEGTQTAMTGQRPVERDKPDGERRPRVNTNDFERLVSAVAGGALVLRGIRNRSVPGALLSLLGGVLLYRGTTGHCHAYELLGIDESQSDDHTAVRAGAGAKVDVSMTIQRPVEELYTFWRTLENLPRVMTHLESVNAIDATRSHWVARGPFGKSVTWDAEIHHEEQNRLIAWRSLPGSQIATAGSVHFDPSPGNRGTMVRVVLKYDPPAGKLGTWFAWLLGENPEHQIREDLRRWKQLLEAGEIATTHGQSSCRG